MLFVSSTYSKNAYADESTGSWDKYSDVINELDIPETADFKSIVVSDGIHSYEALHITEDDANECRSTIIIPFLVYEDGTIEFYSMDDYSEREELGRDSGSGTRGSVSAIATYSKKTKNGTKYYLPQKLEAMTTSVVQMGVQYYTAGSAYNSSLTWITDTTHRININKSSPTVNTWYSTSYPSAYYFNVNLGPYQGHRISIIINGVTMNEISLPSSY